MSISFVHITGRAEPRWDWYVDSICRQTTEEERRDWQFIFVDAKLWAKDWALSGWGSPSIEFGNPNYHDPERRQKLVDVVKGRFVFQHLPPLPNVFQGPFRKTARDWFYAGLNRNTGIIASRHPYVMFCDDLAWPGPIWVAQVKHAAEHRYLLAGQYKKVKALRIEDGALRGYEPFPPGLDSRWAHGSPNGIVDWRGAGVFGCSFGAPLESLLAVDGNGQETAMQGAEDYCLGIRLERTGLPVKLNQNCLTLESEEEHYLDSPLPRQAKDVTADRLPPNYKGSTMSDHVHLNRLWTEAERTLPIIGNNLRAIRDQFLATRLVPIPQEPTVDWRDGTPLSNL